jgi:hypothetical protein
MRFLRAVGLIVVVALTACGGQAPAPTGPSPQAQAKAQADLDAYNQLVAAGSYELAITMGRTVQSRHPGTPQAAEVVRTLPDVQARATAARESQRLSNLWTYQLSEAGGGKQSTASIYESATLPEADKVRLVLRRHADWGQSVYLFASGKGFRCGSGCTLAARVDGAPVSLAAHAPETGEPAVFIDDDAGFLTRLDQKPQRIEIDATLDSRGPVTLLFETGGYEPAKFLPLAD